MALALTLSDLEGGELAGGRSGAPRVMFHQFRKAMLLRMEERMVQNVLPMANHCAPDTREKRTGVVVLRVPA